MTSITITINGKKAGQKVFFKLILTAANFMKVVGMTFNTLEDILNGEKQGLYTIEQ
jgi:cystathionine beta-lyase family protein involved in aluminum resistance